MVWPTRFFILILVISLVIAVNSQHPIPDFSSLSNVQSVCVHTFLSNFYPLHVHIDTLAHFPSASSPNNSTLNTTNAIASLTRNTRTEEQHNHTRIIQTPMKLYSLPTDQKHLSPSIFYALLQNSFDSSSMNESNTTRAITPLTTPSRGQNGGTTSTSNCSSNNNNNSDRDDENSSIVYSTNSNKKRKKKELTNIITSLELLQDQENQDIRDREKAVQEEKDMYEKSHKKKAKAMEEYYDNLEEYYDEAQELDCQRRKRNRGLASAVAGGVTELSNKAVKGVKKGGNGESTRRLWVKDRSNAWWDECSRPEFPEHEFKKAFRMGRATFDMICEELNSVIAKEDTTLRCAIPVRQRVAVCIWRLATGEPLRLVSKRFGLGISTCHKLVLEVCSAIRTVLMSKYLQWPDDDKLRRIKDEFESVSGIPNVVGSMYTTHIPIIAPKISVAAYFNKRHTERNQKTSYSITLQGVVDPKGVFTDVCIGWPGSMPDDQVLEKSALFQRANGGLLKGVWIVGGSGYPLMDWVLVPYTQQHLTWTQHAFNEKIGEIQKVAKDAFARMKGRWSCLQKRTEVKLQDLPIVLGACCVLHNICEIRGEEMDPELMVELIDDEMVPEVALRSVSSLKARDNVAHNLLHHGLAGTSFL